jgi:hypothetical protein
MNISFADPKRDLASFLGSVVVLAKKMTAEEHNQQGYV